MRLRTFSIILLLLRGARGFHLRLASDDTLIYPPPLKRVSDCATPRRLQHITETPDSPKMQLSTNRHQPTEQDCQDMLYDELEHDEALRKDANSNQCVDGHLWPITDGIAFLTDGVPSSLVRSSLSAVLSVILLGASVKELRVMAYILALPVVASAAFNLSEPQLSLNTVGTCFVQYGQGACWGDNSFGQLGRGNTETIGGFGNDANGLLFPLSPIDFGEDFIVKQIAGGAHYHHCASSVDGRCKCFGYNNYGQLGCGDTETRGDEPGEMGVNLTDVDLGAGFVVDTLSLGYLHSCALSTVPSVKCWGGSGRLGLNDTTNRGDAPGEMGENLPALSFPNGFVPAQLDAGYDTSCVVSADGRCACFGEGNYGLTGQGNTADVRTPALVDLGAFFVEFVSVGYQSACAVSSDAALKCWGRNHYGQLGYDHFDDIGDNANEMGVNLPIVTLLGIDFVVKQMRSGDHQRCVLSTDERLKCFGRGTYGALGYGDASAVTGDDILTAEVDLGTNFTVAALATGNGDINHNCALSADSSLLCWGRNQRGQIGVGDISDRYSPVTPLIQLAIFAPSSPPSSAPTTATNSTTNLTTNPSFLPTTSPSAEPTNTPSAPTAPTNSTTNTTTNPSFLSTTSPSTEPTNTPSASTSESVNQSDGGAKTWIFAVSVGVCASMVV